LGEVAKALRLLIGWTKDVPENPDEDAEASIPGYRTYVSGVRYLQGYFNLLDDWGCVHPSFNQVGTSWTRYSSSDPNGQNVSKKAVLPLRRVFGPPPGYVWLAVDYAQLELRIFAYASKDQGLIKAFESGMDFHMQTACEMFGVAPDKVTSEQRRFAKNVNFGIIFGAGPNKIDHTTGRPGTYALYMQKFPNARDYMRRVISGVEEKGYCETLGGYRLYVPQGKAYAAVNGVVQGTAGEIVKNAMVDIHEKGLVDWEQPSEEYPYGGSAIVANIHDELIFQFPQAYPYRALGRRIIRCMEEAGTRLGVVTPCDAKLIFTNWAEGEKFAA
jgi:DNA polymerase-1